MKYIFFIGLIIMVFSCVEKNKSRIENEKIIGLLPYNNFEKEYLDTISNTLSKFYNLKVKILKPIHPSQKAFINIKSSRYRADSLIRFQKEMLLKNKVDYIIGITNFDISTTKTDEKGEILEPTYKYEDWGVMGLGYRPGNSSIVSTFRLKTNDNKLFLNRLKKVVVHEFGHNLGLPHCENKSCVMTSANEKVSTIDNEQLKLCTKCSSQINN